MEGIVGKILIIVAFVASLASGWMYLQSVRRPDKRLSLVKTGRLSWMIMVAAVAGASIILSFLLFTHQFQYHYVWGNTSLDLAPKYLFSAFWAGQEGSFLLWILFTSIAGLLVVRWADDTFEGPVMAVVAFCQAFMISMIVAIKLGPLEIGSSPFTLLAERFPDAPYLQNGGVPPDGNGLNDLLQNYWMVIHPPTLFVGFTTMIVPFAYAIAGLWLKKYTEWVRPALPWALAATLILLVGISLGGYWAYVTLSFGGYWAWDPVENSSFVPFLIGAAAVHTMIAQKKSGSSHKASLLLCILGFMTVLYSTFLTRSGILGDVSVHAFVDLGLYNQFIVWIVVVAVIGFGLFAYRYRELPTPDQVPRVMSREFMIFSGAMVVCAIAAVVLLGTSTPIIGRLFRDNPSGVPIEFYNKWTLPLSAMMALLCGIGQLFWWQKMSIEQLNKLVTKPLLLAVGSTAAILFFTPFAQVTATAPAAAIASNATSLVEAGLASGIADFWGTFGTGLMLLMLMFASFFAFYGNSLVLWRIGRGNPRLAGGSIAHIGLAFALMGIITSSGLNDPIVDARTPGRDNFVIERGQTLFIDGYQVTFSGTQPTPEGYTSYNLRFVDDKNRSFDVNPVVYKSRTEQWIQHPDIKKYIEQDIYVSVAPGAMFDENTSSEKDRMQLQLVQGQVAALGTTPFTISFEQFVSDLDSAHVGTGNIEIAVSAKLELTNHQTGEKRTVLPVYTINKNRQQEFVPASIDDWGLTISFVGMSVNDKSITVLVDGVGDKEPEWIVVQAYRKPFINLLWFGIMLIAVGFGLSIFRRVDENRFTSSRESML